MEILSHRFYTFLALGVLGLLLVTGCGGTPAALPPTPTEQMAAPTEEAEKEEAAQEAVQTEEAEHEEAQTEEAEHEEAQTEEAEHEEAQTEEEHMEEAEHEEAHAEEEHMEGEGHGVPEEAAAVPNPIEASAESIEAGAAVYAANCAICHGETGEGDGPAAASMEKKPSDLHADHVQENSDGALFYIISNGVPETPMPAWENVLSEEERWHVINFMRTFGE